MTLPLSPTLESYLDASADTGLDLVYFAVVHFGGAIGTKYYCTRLVPALMPSYALEDKLMGAPQVSKRFDASSVRFDALNDDITIRLRNTPERGDGKYDSGKRIQDLMVDVPLNGARVEIGMADIRAIASWSDIKWDGVYRVDRVDRDNTVVALYCVDQLLHPGEVMLGSTITDADFPLAPTESYGTVRGAVFGKVDTLPLVPVEVGLSSSLANEIDDQDGVIDLADNLDNWPLSGYVEIGDEVVYYPVIDKALKRLGSSGSKCTRGTGYPRTTVASHADNAVVRELYTGKEALLDGAHLDTATSITLKTPGDLPAAGVMLVDNEAIRYNTKVGLVLSGLSRGVAVPTIARVHDIGTSVRTIPTAPDGTPRYRYVVAEGQVTDALNVRVVDEGNTMMPYSGGAGVLSQVTMASGKVWSVLDLPARPRFEKFEKSGTGVPQEWIFETDGRQDAEGVALPESFARWKPASTMSAAHLTTWPRAIDSTASTRAVILEATTGKNIFAMVFDARWDAGLNSPRRRYGRFRNARLKMRVQYDRQTATQPVFQVHSNGTLVKSGVFFPPTIGGGAGGGNLSGGQQIPKETWNTQGQTRKATLVSKTTGTGVLGSTIFWADLDGSGSGGSNHGLATNGSPDNFVCGAWDATNARPRYFTDTEWASISSQFKEPLVLSSSDVFPASGSEDKLISCIVTLINPVATLPSRFNNTSQMRTGFRGSIKFYTNTNYTNLAFAESFELGRSSASVEKIISLAGRTWAQIQSFRIEIDQTLNTTLNGNSGRHGANIGSVNVDFVTLPQVEGQKNGFLVDGSYFTLSASTTPSTVFDQVISLGQAAKDWARANDRDPWDFFSSSISEGMRLSVQLPSAGDALRFAVADVELEIEYEALAVVYDGTVVADVDGRSFLPIGGVVPQVCDNPVDILAHLVDDSEFLGLAGQRSSEWEAHRDFVDTYIGWHMARAIVEQVSVREFIASLCAETRLLLLSDGLELNIRFRWEETKASDAVRTIGDQPEPAYALVSDAAPIVNRLEDICNSIGFYFKRSYLTGNFTGIIEEENPASIAMYGKRRATPNLEWHQSLRGYDTHGYYGIYNTQWHALKWLTQYTIATAARLWDYATFEITTAAGEDLQRYDTLVVNRPRAGYYGTSGRVVQVTRLESPLRYQVLLQMNRITDGFIWQSDVEPSTYIKAAEAGARIDFVVAGQLQAQLQSDGSFRCRGDFINAMGTTTEAIKLDTGAEICIYTTTGEGDDAALYSRVLYIDSAGNVTLHGRKIVSGGSTTQTIRDVLTPEALPAESGATTIVDTSDAVTTGELKFYVANTLVLVINKDAWLGLGDLKTNQGMMMGSI